jgi:predicted DNA-binding protein
MAMHRTQLFLDEEQHRRLVRLAATRGRTISEIVRDYVERGLREDQQDRQKRREALLAIHEGRREMEHSHGVYQGDPVAEAREERARDFDRVLAEWRDAEGDAARR